MSGLVLTIHIIICLFLVAVVLLQTGKEGMGVIFGGGSESAFGGGGAGGLLVKITAFLAVAFLLTSLAYNKLTGVQALSNDSIMMRSMPASQEEVKEDEDQPKPEVLFEDSETDGGEQTSQ
ncbi:preprotein translocase subunit SecG [Desulfohalovibrio reitneri]|uniref:preprotein translocase subunit SecG n=1 Tax=Desulfohalovibrio reitneri TaxID=1307759 RepID=UPI0004A72DAD|nr:preprotein translocase subunit SecG [Desulfohalovibrio reitneri]